ncbi:MAG: lysylphosphatidylglycerol synthase transmembrane domain-containing protein [candidate division WOR-3 bacterium]
MKIPGLSKRNIIISVGFVLFVILIITVKTTSKETLLALKSANFKYLIIACLCWILYILFDGTRFSLAALSVSEKRLDIITAIKIISIGIFLAAVTPFQVAGLPVQIMLLNKRKIGIGKSTAILAARGFIAYSTVLIAVLISLKTIWPPPSDLIKGVVIYATSIVLGIVIIYGLAIFAPKLISKVLKSKRLLEEINSLRETTISFVRNSSKILLLFAFLSSFISHLSLCAIPYFLALSFNTNIKFTYAFSFQSLIQGGLIWTPTPGGTGIAEGVSLLIFKNYINSEILGLFVILWRFFTHHITAIVGALFLLDEARKF